MLEDSVKTIRNGEIVQGTVIDVKEDEIILNIGYKADGIITKNEYSNDASLVLTDAVHVGDTMEAKVLKVNDGEGQVTLTYKRLAAEKGNKRLEEAFENQEVLKAPVTQVLDGGLCVNVDEARVFIPASLVSDTYEKDLSKYADQEIEFVITEFNPRRRRIIGNRKQLLLAEKAEKQKELMEKINNANAVAADINTLRTAGNAYSEIRVKIDGSQEYCDNFSDDLVEKLVSCEDTVSPSKGATKVAKITGLSYDGSVFSIDAYSTDSQYVSTFVANLTRLGLFSTVTYDGYTFSEGTYTYTISAVFKSAETTVTDADGNPVETTTEVAQ